MKLLYAVSAPGTRRTRTSDLTAQSAVALRATVGSYLSFSTDVMLSVFRVRFKHQQTRMSGNKNLHVTCYDTARVGSNSTNSLIG